MINFLEDVSPSCEIPIRDLEEFYKELLSDKSDVAFEKFEGVLEKQNLEALSRPFSKAEMKSQMDKVKDTAPGADGILYSDLKRCDPSGEILLTIFQRCFTEKRCQPCGKRPDQYSFTRKVILRTLVTGAQ